MFNTWRKIYVVSQSLSLTDWWNKFSYTHTNITIHNIIKVRHPKLEQQYTMYSAFLTNGMATHNHLQVGLHQIVQTKRIFSTADMK